jgi:molybdate transport system substrate-binding protein
MSARSSTRTSLALILVAAAGCSRSHAAPLPSPLKVAAAADLALAFKEVGDAYEKESGQKVIFSFGSTGLLEKQIVEGAPFDVFAAANVSFAEEAIQAGACLADSKALYARGRIVMWAKKGSTPPPKTVAGLVDPRYVKIALANPEHAPYGRAAMQAFEKAGVVDKLKPRLVYGENVQQTLQFAQSGNADIAVVALSLAIVTKDGEYVEIDDGMHKPIDQALVVCGKQPARLTAARGFTGFVNSPAGRAIMKRYGFLLPGETHARLP